MKRILILFLLVWLVSWVLTSQSQAQVSEYISGDLGFSYQQVYPPGPDAGTISYSGESFSSEIFPPGVDEVVGGVHGYVEGTYGVLCYGAAKREALSMDLFVMLILSDAPLTAGVYPIDMEAGTLFAYGRNLSIAEIPVELTVASILAFLESITAEHVMASATGAITVTAAGDDAFSCAFSGVMVDEFETGYSASNGSINLSGDIQAAQDLDWYRLKNLYR